MSEPQQATRSLESNINLMTNPIARTFFDNAARVARGSKEGWAEITRGTREWSAWEEYFQKLGWTPAAFKVASAFTAPTQWPEWFDRR